MTPIDDYPSPKGERLAKRLPAGSAGGKRPGCWPTSVLWLSSCAAVLAALRASPPWWRSAAAHPPARGPLPRLPDISALDNSRRGRETT